ncbi:tartrate-resistant acid phosphatase type 5 [Patella vulgata]|uniref:tartrate-resistant acid phosphatase type 5 n=1 Tax=Patella vulgata TaxID=6465 RepID=UPI0024A90CE6|nr:tartrate-resistant acid phosphatase type 5 [Patella vulgata]
MKNRFMFVRYLICIKLGYLITNANSQSLKFLVIGDWGGTDKFPYTTVGQVSTARQMEQLAEKEHPEFVLALGDNFYNDGVETVDDPRFQDTFENVYTSAAINIPWYLIAGNHDYYGNVSAQIAYTKVSKRWNFPHLYHSQSFNIPGTSDTIDILMIDTVLLCETDDREQRDNQWEWIERNLKNSNAKYLFTAGHHPIYSIGCHGGSRCLEDKLLPLLYKYTANGHFAGHDHCLQHLQTSKEDITLDFIVSGAANDIVSDTQYKEEVPENYLKFHFGDKDSKGGLCFIDANSDRLKISFVEANGDDLYQTTIFPRYI